jgi:hypothetical protein
LRLGQTKRSLSVAYARGRWCLHPETVLLTQGLGDASKV